VQVLSRIQGILLAMILLAALGGCRTTAGKKGGDATEDGTAATVQNSPPAPPLTLPVGLVHHVDEPARFVLIRSSKGLKIEPETILTIHGDQGETVARVKVSPARKESFLTADFLDGLPRKGQQVTMEYQKTPLAGSATPVIPDPSDPNAVQVLE
jgi:hypothetical protein